MCESFDAVFDHEVVLIGAPAEELDGAECEGVGVGSEYGPEAVEAAWTYEGADQPSEGVGVRGSKGALETKQGGVSGVG